MNEEYEPFGEEWEKEMMRLNKRVLIEMIRVQFNKIGGFKLALFKISEICWATPTICGGYDEAATNCDKALGKINEICNELTGE